MNKLKEAAKIYAEQESSCYSNDYNGFINGAKWQQQNTLTLDSKIKDGEIVEEPESYKRFISGKEPLELWHPDVKRKCKEYQNLPTLRECLKELEQLKCYVNTVQKPSVERYEEVEKQLQAERQKVKDMEKGLKRIKEYGQIESIDALIDELLNQ